MPAIEHSFSETLPTELFLDTDIFIAYLVSAEPHHERCRLFLRSMGRQGDVTIYLSSLVWIEFVHVVSRERFRARLPQGVRTRFRLDRWEEPEVRESYVDSLLAEFEALVGQYDWAEIPLTSSIRQLAMRYISRYNLGPHDAVHLASATEAGVVNLASLDRAYRRVDGLHLWNDLIHASSTT